MSGPDSGRKTVDVVFDREIDFDAMPSETVDAYNAALAKGDALLDTDADAAMASFAEADEIARPYKKEEEEEEKQEAETERPPPTAPNPHPPEVIPDTSDAVAVCTSPDVCRTPDKPVPYMVMGKADDDQNYAGTVRSNGQIIKKWDSKFTTTYGDEPGVGKGVKSGTVGDVVEPTSHSTIVRAEGQWVIRHGDTCTLNNGNCPGEYIHVKSTETHPAPDGNDEEDKAWYEKAWDWTSDKVSEAGEAINEFDQNNYKVVTRGAGALQAVGGVVEGVAGAALAGAGGIATGSGVGAPVGVPAAVGGTVLVVNGVDNAQAGLRTLWTGEYQSTAIAGASGEIATALGASEATAQTIEDTVNVVQGVAGGTGAAAATMKTAGRATTAAGRGAAAISDDTLREATEAEARSAAQNSPQSAGRPQATSGETGARFTRRARTKAELLPNGKVPAVRNGEFERWFDDLSPDELEMLWNDRKIQDAIKSRIRHPGGYHEWLMASRTPTFKRWDIPMRDIKALRTLTAETRGINPDWVHGGTGSTTAHNELGKIIDNSLDRDQFVRNLNNWADYRLTHGRSDLPRGLRLGN